jgi:hypothetical protein
MGIFDVEENIERTPNEFKFSEMYKAMMDYDDGYSTEDCDLIQEHILGDYKFKCYNYLDSHSYWDMTLYKKGNTKWVKVYDYDSIYLYRDKINLIGFVEILREGPFRDKDIDSVKWSKNKKSIWMSLFDLTEEELNQLSLL